MDADDGVRGDRPGFVLARFLFALGMYGVYVVCGIVLTGEAVTVGCRGGGANVAGRFLAAGGGLLMVVGVL